ncbi:MAG TPA: FAD-dependent oxidoreductase [Thermotogota bacterium]|nr:FAD-dependent oxidoreductase [Thermotogota bacterium]HNT95017.1 FAD-dependent oxidoreductase [Thermotogota bacterium]HPB86107.1 FAD-dependent oxidoreductase [Thermotogota bacterium]HPM19987.1 FAD-dependent oxidoreductase [Thermotogota bacterium]HPX97471.1 FAD-dependent oxidoreductase [Thermotogota bacterium]
MDYDVIVIGGGLSGLTAASLLSKRGLKVAVVDKSYNPGGSCGIFKRNDAVFDQGSAMLFGFGEKGFNAHRFVFNCLEEPIDILQHDYLYCLNFKGHRIHFWADIDRFAEELGTVFPSEKENIGRFYRDLTKMYQHVMVENPAYTTPDETDPKNALKSLLKHPLSYLKFIGYLNKSADSVLRHYFTDPEIFKFYDKLTSTYCYTTVKESPAVLASVMFVDNHVGGSYYPAGSTLFLPGKLEKVIEANGGEMLLEKEVVKILFDDGHPVGVLMKSGEKRFAKNLVYSGTVWNLYGKLIDANFLKPKRIQWAQAQEPTYPSVVLYATVDKRSIPEDTAPVEMLVGNPDKLDESEVTAYLFSIDDRTLCAEDEHTVIAIGPTFEKWEGLTDEAYQTQKERERARLIGVLDRRFPGFSKAIRISEVATPRTIERYTMKNGGAVAGPKQSLGQHMFHRLHTRTEWDTLFCCGESTVMGTGTPTVTTSGIAAANAILKTLNLEPFVHHHRMKNYVRIVPHPYTRDQLYSDWPEDEKAAAREANRCQLCERPGCMVAFALDIRGIMRRVAVGNFMGAKRIVDRFYAQRRVEEEDWLEAEKRCVRNDWHEPPVAIRMIIAYLRGQR